MSEFIIKKEYELTCLSPVHIGSGEELEPSEYIYDNKKSRVGFLDWSKLKKLLYSRQSEAKSVEADDWRSKLKQSFNTGQDKTLLDELAEGIMAGEKSLFVWLKKQGLKESDIEPLVTHWASVGAIKEANEYGQKKQNLNKIARHVTHSDGSLYIPGSSLKGAFRTAVIFSMLRDKPSVRAHYRQELQEVLSASRNAKGELNRLAGKLENELVNNLSLKEKDGRPANGAVRSAFRGLRVSDAVVCNSTGAGSVIVQRRDIFPEGGENPLPLCYECIPAGSRLRFSVTFEPAMMEEIGVYDFEDIIANLEAFSDYNLNLLKKAFTQHGELIAEAEKATFMLGGAAGFLSKSLWYSLFEDKGYSNPQKLLAKYFDNVYRSKGKAAHQHVQKDQVVSPRTLKIAEIGGRTQLMGLCQIEE